MQNKLEIGSNGYIIESNRTITNVVVIAKHGELYVLRMPTGGAIKLRRGRIFLMMMLSVLSVLIIFLGDSLIALLFRAVMTVVMLYLLNIFLILLHPVSLRFVVHLLSMTPNLMPPISLIGVEIVRLLFLFPIFLIQILLIIKLLRLLVIINPISVCLLLYCLILV